MRWFSIIVPTHNGAERLRESLESVKKQVCTDYELIVVCDSCTDDSYEIAKSYTHNVIKTNVHNDGLARNKGLEVALGEWILFLDDDDHFLHEYVLTLLKDYITDCNTVGCHEPPDVIGFSYICRGTGYMKQTPEHCYTMCWAYCWERAAISDTRFKNIPYGADNQFYEDMMKKKPFVEFWDMPMYYYNYMREGSMTYNKIHEGEEEKKSVNKFLDIIVTHCDEPWETGKAFFDMLEHQQCADFSKVNITLVQDGRRGELPWDKLLSGYSYDVNVETLEVRCGVATARNFGLSHTSADWVMFCNFDDMFSSVFALNLILANFPNNDYDIIWGKYAVQTKWCTGDLFINCVDDPNYTSVANKLYRRGFIMEKNVRFMSKFNLHYDYAFNSIALAETSAQHVVTLTANDYLYLKTYRADSIRHTPDGHKNLIDTLQDRNIELFYEFLRRDKQYEAAKMFMQTLCSQYYAIYNPAVSDPPETITEDICSFYNEYKNMAELLSDADIEVIKDETETEITNIIQPVYNETGMEYYFVNDELSFAEWLKKLDESGNANTSTVTDPEIEPAQENRPERIVAYCGTRNVYDDMLTSAKSLLCHTPVDKIYLFTEDNDYNMPEELPPIFNVLNVSGQTAFPKDGPNYKNTWTYMCMIRAIYPTLLSSYSKVLSLDVDTIVQDDISDLWDIDISDAYLAGVPEPQRQKHPDDPIYVNFGVVMMNLDKLRQDGKQQEIVDILNRKKVDCPEQGAFNQACAGRIIPIPNDYNVTVYSHITGTPDTEKILHYAGHRFWKHYRSVRRYADMSWEDVMKEQERVRMEESNKNSRNPASRAEDE